MTITRTKLYYISILYFYILFLQVPIHLYTCIISINTLSIHSVLIILIHILCLRTNTLIYIHLIHSLTPIRIQALSKALSLGHTGRLLTILKTIAASEGDGDTAADVIPQNYDPSTSNKLDIYIKKWSIDDIEKVLLYTRDWNTNSKNSYICSIIINSIFTQHGIHILLNLPKINEVLPGLISYTERHQQRIHKLHESMYLSEYILSVMSYIPPTTTNMYTIDSGFDQNNGPKPENSEKDEKSATANKKRKIVEGIENRIHIIPDIFGDYTDTTTNNNTANTDVLVPVVGTKSSKKTKKV